MSRSVRILISVGTLIRPPALAVAAVCGLSLQGCHGHEEEQVAPDSSPPEMVSSAQNLDADPSGRTMTVGFSEVVTAESSEDVNKYSMTNGINVLSATRQVDGHFVDLGLDAAPIPGEDSLTVLPGIEDTSGNASSVPTVAMVTSTDTSTPSAISIAGFTESGPWNDTITAVFDDDMIASDAEDPSNWIIESPAGMPFDVTGASVVYNAATRAATLTLDENAAAQNLQTNDEIFASFIGLRDLGGNDISRDMIGGVVLGDATPPALLSVRIGASNTVELTFSEHVDNLETSDLISGAVPDGTQMLLTDLSDVGSQAGGTIGLSGVPADGDTITISDGTTEVVLEFDLGAVGGFELLGQPNDEDTLVIDDGSSIVTFEFDNNLMSGGTSVLIGLTPELTLLNLLVAIQLSGLTVTPAVAVNPAELTLVNASGGLSGNTTLSGIDTAMVQVRTNFQGGGVAVSNTGVPVDVSDITNTVATLRSAIDGSPCDITTSVGGTLTDFVLTNDFVGNAGNVAIEDVDAGDVITVTGMSGGQDAPQPYAPTVSTALAADFQATVTFPIAAGSLDTLRIYGVTDLAGNQMMPDLARGFDVLDATAPSIDAVNTELRVESGSNNDSVTVAFDRPLHPASATDPNNYMLEGTSAISLEGVELHHSMDTPLEVAILFREGSGVNLNAALAHTLTVTGVSNLQGETRVSPDVLAGIAPVGDQLAPAVGAADAVIDPSSPTSAIVTFNEDVSEAGALDPANYMIAGNATVTTGFITPRVVRVDFQTALNVSDSLDILEAAATDLAGNAAAGVTTVALSAADTVAPVFTSITAMTDEANVRDRIHIVCLEPIPTALLLDAANFVVTSGGEVVDLAGATLMRDGLTGDLLIDLAEAVALTTGDPISVVPSNLTDVVGNVMATDSIAGVVSGDIAPPTVEGAFVNYREHLGSTVVDVVFSEAMILTSTTDTANWQGSDGQDAVEVITQSSRRFRIVLNGSMGPSDTLALFAPLDRAGNLAATIAIDPVE